MSQEFIRFFDPASDSHLYGRIEGESVVAFDAAPWDNGTPTNEVFSAQSIQITAPVQPSKIVCIGLNYHAHVAASQSADEAPEYPLIFLKPSSSIIGPNDKVVHPTQTQRVDYEAELGVVIGREARNVAEADALDYIFGYTCVNDVTARDLQKKDGQWSRAKGFDTFCPVGPSIVTDIDVSDVLVEGILNGEVKQSGKTSLMIFDIPFLISYVSSIMTLNPGDLISTGTPSGIGPMKPGDTVEVVVENVGRLVNQVAEYTDR